MVEITELTKKFKKKTAVDHVTLALDTDTYGLVGPNGAGKTTLLRMLAGVLAPVHGTIEYKKQHPVIGYLPQKFGCIPELSVEQQLIYFSNLKKLPKSGQQEDMKRVLDLVHLADLKKLSCRKLSGG